MKKKIQIDIVSDVVCPWCYIGEARLNKAIDMLKDSYEFSITYHPFELNPHIPEGGVNAREYFADKFGSASRMEQIFEQTAQTAHSEGLPFDLNLQEKAPNTFHAHRLLALAKAEGVQLAAMHTFFKAYFAEGKDLTQKETLLELAIAAGMDAQKTEKVLSGHDFEDEVIQSEQLWQSRGITSVPSFIINNQYLIQGAQPPEAFREVFEQLHPQGVSEAPGCEGDSCSI